MSRAYAPYSGYPVGAAALVDDGRLVSGCNVVVPCGRCRQLLAEHADPAMVLDLPGGLMPMAEALPFAFGPGDLNAVERTAPFESKEN